MVSLLVGLQQEWASRSEELLELGLPDWRGPSLTRDIASVVERTASELRDADRRALDRFVERLPERFADLEATGLPDGLVHGDFHPGNTRGDGADLVLLDWGDSGVGHPLLDQPAFLDRIPPSAVELVREHWDAEWRRAVPGADPTRAAALLAPVAAARQALIYRGFLDRIEPSEHPYHAADPADWLGRTAALLR
jgi:aminoglycoside phosphotransferase (APT) family kinase protein